MSFIQTLAAPTLLDDSVEFADFNEFKSLLIAELDLCSIAALRSVEDTMTTYGFADAEVQQVFLSMQNTQDGSEASSLASSTVPCDSAESLKN